MPEKDLKCGYVIELICRRCGKKWDYKGKRKFWACCPDCHTSVKIAPFSVPPKVKSRGKR